MTTRRAVLADMPMLMAMAREEHAHSQFADIEFVDARAEQTFTQFIESLATVVFISEGGFIMGMIQPLVFSKRWNAYEVAWYSEDGSGLDLLRAFTKWATGMRAINLIVHNHAGMVPDEKFSRVLKRKGFDKLGSTYAKKLGDIQCRQ